MGTTEQSLEGLDTARVLFSFLQLGIHQFTFQDIIKTCPSLKGLKEQTFQRWMNNPFYTTHKGNGLITFNYRRSTPFIFSKNTTINGYGLDLPILYCGYEPFVRWIRIWSSHFTGVAAPDKGKYKNIIKLLRDLHSNCKRYTLAEIRTHAVTALQNVYQLAYDYKGYPNYSANTIEAGRKTVITIHRPLQKSRIAPPLAAYKNLPELPIDVSIIFEE